jgi:hypothetical protein
MNEKYLDREKLLKWLEELPHEMSWKPLELSEIITAGVFDVKPFGDDSWERLERDTKLDDCRLTAAAFGLKCNDALCDECFDAVRDGVFARAKALAGV